MKCVIDIDPVIGEYVYCKEDEYRSLASHWKSVAETLAGLVADENEAAAEYAAKVIKARRPNEPK